MLRRYSYYRLPKSYDHSYSERGTGAPSRSDKQINQVLRNVSQAVITKNHHHVRDMRAR